MMLVSINGYLDTTVTMRDVLLRLGAAAVYVVAARAAQ